MRGVCRLCQKVADLRRSHFLPAGSFKALVDSFSPKETVPVMIDSGTGTAVYTSKQIRKYLLCSSCEQKFNRHGENEVMAHCHRGEGKFKLKDIVKSIKPSYTQVKTQAFFSEDLSRYLNPQSYAYFALSVFWRGSAEDWGGTHSHYYGALGKKYSEIFRRFLMGETPFPEDVYVQVHVDFDEPISTNLMTPGTKKNSLGTYNFKAHHFMIPGITFIAMIGGDTYRYKNAISGTTKSDVIFFASKFSGTSLYRQLAKDSQKMTPKGKLSDEWNLNPSLRI